MRSAVCSLLLCLTAADLVAADQSVLPVLTTGGTDLGRLFVLDTADGLAVQLDLDGDLPQRSFAIARFQSNQALAQGADGRWRLWNGNVTELTPASTQSDGDSLTFSISNGELSDLPFPVIFTIGYTTTDTTKFGYLVVDEP